MRTLLALFILWPWGLTLLPISATGINWDSLTGTFLDYWPIFWLVFIFLGVRRDTFN
jgi:hypothetical protein